MCIAALLSLHQQKETDDTASERDMHKAAQKHQPVQ